MRILAAALVACSFFMGLSSARAAETDVDVANPAPHALESTDLILKRVKEDKAVLYDVREKREWDEGHLDEAKLLPLTELGKKLTDPAYVEKLKKDFPKDKPIYLHCKVGGRSVLAGEALRKELGPEYDFRPLKQGYDELLEAGFVDSSLRKASPVAEASPKTDEDT